MSDAFELVVGVAVLMILFGYVSFKNNPPTITNNGAVATSTITTTQSTSTTTK